MQGQSQNFGAKHPCIKVTSLNILNKGMDVTLNLNVVPFLILRILKTFVNKSKIIHIF